MRSPRRCSTKRLVAAAVGFITLVNIPTVLLIYQSQLPVVADVDVSSSYSFYKGEQQQHNKLTADVSNSNSTSTERDAATAISTKQQAGQANQSKLKIPKTAIFFNTYLHPNRTIEGQAIIKNQLWRINNQPLLDNTDIHYTRFGDINTTSWPDLECVGGKKRRCHQIKAAEKGDEVVAIQALYEYCLQNKEDRVIYMHSKGTFTPNRANNSLRSLLMNAILSDECVTMPNDESCSTCSTQLAPFPFFSYIGNMMVAECSYVQKLIPAKDFEKAKRHVIETILNATSPTLSFSPEVNDTIATEYVTKIEGRDNPLVFKTRRSLLYQLMRPSWIGIERYAMEHYFLSHPDAKPCEVFSKMDPMVVPIAYGKSRNLDKNSYRIKKKSIEPTLQKIPELVKDKNVTDMIVGGGLGTGIHPFYLRDGRIFQYRALYPEANALRKDSWLHDYFNNSKYEN